MRPPSPDALQRLVDFYETLTPASLGAVREVYAADASFRDPFNDVRGSDEVQRVLLHMFENLSAAKFVIREAVADGDQAFLVWDFHFRMRRWKPDAQRKIHGSSHVRFDGQGRVSYHRDYWDAAEEVYDKIPLLGSVLRAIRRKMG
ncbi:MAG: nuclear transport factor 2 family protein [Betaproteobacteria bacterium]